MYFCFLSGPQLELQRQQLLAERQQFQRDQLKAAEMRALQSPTLAPQTPLLFPPQKATPTVLAPPPSTPAPQSKPMEVEQSVSVTTDPVPVEKQDSIPENKDETPPLADTVTDNMEQQQDNVVAMDTEETATGKVDTSPDNKEQEVTPASPLKENELKEVNDHPQNSSESVIDNEGGEESVNSVLPAIPELPDVLPPSEDSSTTRVTEDNPPENMETDTNEPSQ